MGAYPVRCDLGSRARVRGVWNAPGVSACISGLVGRRTIVDGAGKYRMTPSGKNAWQAKAWVNHRAGRTPPPWRRINDLPCIEGGRTSVQAVDEKGGRLYIFCLPTFSLRSVSLPPFRHPPSFPRPPSPDSPPSRPSSSARASAAAVSVSAVACHSCVRYTHRPLLSHVSETASRRGSHVSPVRRAVCAYSKYLLTSRPRSRYVNV